MERQKITEESGIHKAWYKEAESKKMTMKTLPAFLKKLTEEYEHDYGTICHAVTAGALATARAIDRSPGGGITGFQAGCIMWDFIKHWMHYKNPMRLVDYENMLYPQYETKFTCITPSTWKWLRGKAKQNLKEKQQAHPEVLKHWQEIANGVIPFGYNVTKEEKE